MGNSWVKTIFFSLLSFIVATVVICLFTEYNNLSLSSANLKSIITRTVRKSCDYYAQETYKDGSRTTSLLTSGNAIDLLDENGDLAVSGSFFIGNDEETIYNSLYKDSNDFKSFIKSSVDCYNGTAATYKVSKNIAGTWKNLDMISYALGLNIASGLSSRDKAFGEYLVEDHVTPLNTGVVYLDKDSIDRISAWNIVSNLSEGRSNNIYVKNGTYNSYVMYKGFRVYYETFHIKNITYRVYDINTTGGREALRQIVSLDASNLYYGGDSDERKYVCVAQIEYDINMDYIGITPFRRVIEYLFTHQVKGLTNHDEGGVNPYDTDTIDRENPLTNTNTTVRDANGDIQWSLPVSGEIYYYIIR